MLYNVGMTVLKISQNINFRKFIIAATFNPKANGQSVTERLQVHVKFEYTVTYTCIKKPLSNKSV